MSKKKIFINIPYCSNEIVEKKSYIQNLEINYLSAKELKDKMGKNYELNNTFTLVCNPLTRYISKLKYENIDKKYLNKIPFYTDVCKKNDKMKNMYEYIYDDNISLVKKVFSFKKDCKKFEEFTGEKLIQNRNKDIKIQDLTQEHLESVYDTFFMDYNLFGYLNGGIIKYYLDKIKDNNIIITFVDTNYIPIFNIFYQNFKKLNLKNLLVISLDDKTFIHMRKRNIFSLLFKYELKKRNNFWDFRYNIINNLFKLSKKNIIHSDSDCIWFNDITKNPVFSLQYDIIGQQAFGIPGNVVKILGSVLCCGFYKINYNENTSDLFNEISNKIYNQNIKDDQVKINNFILREHDKITNTQFGKSITIKNKNIKILLLNTNFVSRKLFDIPLLFHPCLYGNFKEKEEMLKNLINIYRKNFLKSKKNEIERLNYNKKNNINSFTIDDFQDKLEDIKNYYKENGYIIVDKILESNIIDKTKNSFTDGICFENLWKKNDNVKKIAGNKDILNILKKIYNDYPLPFQTMNYKNCKESNHHTDLIHYCPSEENLDLMCSVLYAFEDFTFEKSQLIIYPKSHKDRKILDLNKIGEYEDYEKYMKYYASSKYKQTNILLPKGSVIILASNLIYGNNAFESNKSRLSMITRYFFGSTKYWWSPILSGKKKKLITDVLTNCQLILE